MDKWAKGAVAVMTVLTLGAGAQERWSTDKAWNWYHAQPWSLGFNFVPSTASNTTEFWGKDTFDESTIDREMGWAEALGFNSCRVFTQYLVWKEDPQGFKQRFSRFLEIAARHRVSVIPTLFDDCTFGDPPLTEPFLGKQREPIPGMIIPSWTPSPGLSEVSDQAAWPDLEAYVKDFVGAFRDDARVLLWDLYNEPGNSGMGEKSLPLLRAVFGWARSANPSQPLSVAVWQGNADALSKAMLELSDVITFHAYTDNAGMRQMIEGFKAHKRPVICSEWMARLKGARFETELPLFKEQGVGCYMWGFVNGRTQTQFAWESPRSSAEPKVWFHDLLYHDGQPYDPAEVEAVRKASEGLNPGVKPGALPAPPPLTAASVRQAPCSVRTVEGPSEGVEVLRSWSRSVCKSVVTNKGANPICIKEIVLATISISLPGDTRMYGEGFTMLSQTGGTLEKPEDLGYLTDRDHYKIPQPADATAAYGLLTISPVSGGHLLFGFTSCRRFAGKFYVRPNLIEIAIDAEGLALEPGQTWELEEFMFESGPDRAALLKALAANIGRYHPRLDYDPIPAGWCSWYCFGPLVTAKQVLNNLDFIAKNIPEMRFIQIDDGYQPAMGDWLETGKAFGGDVRGIIRDIRAKGFQPGIWVAPFIAEEKSRLFQEHPNWFIKDAEGKPLASDRVTFGGWRNGPWYAVDGTNPEAQKHIEHVFRTMREEWGCSYFKLDANFWGAMHGGRFNDPKATRVEAYRRGMEAALRGAGDAFVLGCNHPLWPSLGLIHGSRSSMDISREWDSFRRIARENFGRNWQNGLLWWNDPDCLLLTGKQPENEFVVHATSICATGGMLLSGDDLTRIPPDRLAMLRKLIPPAGRGAAFDTDQYETGVLALADRTLLFFFNWTEAAKDLRITLPGPLALTDFWSGEGLGRQEGTFELKAVPPRSARLIVGKP